MDAKKAVKETKPVKPNSSAIPKDEPMQALLNRMKTLEDENQTFKKMLEHERTVSKAKTDNEDEFEEISRLVEQLYDPYDTKNPFKILAEIPSDNTYPDGQVLSWKNPTLRNRGAGWKGWIPICWGDEYCGKDGEKLEGLIVETPEQYQGPDRVDNYVRRGESILARLPKAIFKSRSQKRVLQSMLDRRIAGSKLTQVLSEGVEIVGEGMKDSVRPRDGKWKMGEKPLKDEDTFRTELFAENR